MSGETDYQKFRGKCREFVEQAIKEDPSLKAVRGWYVCPLWGKQAHWWTVRPDGSIFDPTVAQFPTKGVGADYIPFTGTFPCAECGKEIREEDAIPMGNYGVCSDRCARRLVGI